jgi:DinB superfamily
MNIIEELQSTRSETLTYFELPQDELNKSYGPGKWTVRYILHHLADAETVLFDRIRRIISEPRQVLWAFDQEAWANKLNYSELPLEISRHIYTAVREGIIYYARGHYETSGQLEYVHSETGVRTLKEEFDKVVWHNQGHLEQIRKAVGSSSGK